MVKIGTCSWAEKTLLESGEFYPREVRTSEERLRYYASHFDTVEIDSTYYGIPDQKTAWLWDVRTPRDFIFHIKVYGALTGHGIDPRSLPKDIRSAVGSSSEAGRYIYVKDPEILQLIAQRFNDALLPLKRSGKLGLMVFQFPPWFGYKTSNLDYILTCRQLMGDLTIAAEFRHGSWLLSGKTSTVFSFLRENGITYVSADEPQYGNLSTIPFVPYVTTDTAYFRFHGRNRENWQKKNIETSLRYAYRYSDVELREFIPSLKKAEQEARTTYAMFNNCHRGSAVLNAGRLKEMLMNGAVNHQS